MRSRRSPTGVPAESGRTLARRGANWLGFGRSYNEQRFSPLTRITAANVSGLKVEAAPDPALQEGMPVPFPEEAEV